MVRRFVRRCFPERLRRFRPGDTPAQAESPSSSRKDAGALASATKLFEDAASEYAARLAELHRVRKDMEERSARQAVRARFCWAALALCVLASAVSGVAFFRHAFENARKNLATEEKLFEKQASEMQRLLEQYRALLEQSRERQGILRELTAEWGPSVKFSEEILAQARRAVENGRGRDVLWGEAILAQEQGDRKKACAFWTAILAELPRNGTALFGAALACSYGALDDGVSPRNALKSLREGIARLEMIPPAWRNATVRNTLAILFMEQARRASAVAVKEQTWKNAGEQLQRVVKVCPADAVAWCNWGNLLADRADAAADAAIRNSVWDEAEGKYRRATETDPACPRAWYNWGRLLMRRAQEAAAEGVKRHLLENARERLEKAAALDRPAVVYDLACIASLRHDAAQCLAYLEESLRTGGLPPTPHLREDADLDPVRDSEAFRMFLEKVRRERGEL